MDHASKTMPHATRNNNPTGFKVFRALRLMRPDRAFNALLKLRDAKPLPERSLVGQMAKSAGKMKRRRDAEEQRLLGGHNIARKGRKRAIARRLLSVAYHSLKTITVLPLMYFAASVYPEGKAEARPGTLATLMHAPANAVSRWFGRVASSRRIPQAVHRQMIRAMIKAYGVDTNQLEKPIKEYETFQEFFSRKLIDGARAPHPTAPLVSPCDGEVLRVGTVCPDENTLLQVKGNTYSIDQLMQFDVPSLKESHGEERAASMTRWYVLFHLRPKDYHRFHAPTDMTVDSAVHVPGTLFPVTQTAAKWIPDLFSTNERVSLLCQSAYGPMVMIPVGATMVGSIRLGFDPDLRTNTSSTAKHVKALLRPPHPTAPRAVAVGGNQRLLDYNGRDTKMIAGADDENDEDGDDTSFEDDDSGPFSGAPGSVGHLHQRQRPPPLQNQQHQTGVCDTKLASPKRIAPPRQASEYGTVEETSRKSYNPPARLKKGEDMGWFNWGSAIVLVVDLPKGKFKPMVETHSECRVGMPLFVPTDL